MYDINYMRVSCTYIMLYLILLSKIQYTQTTMIVHIKQIF